MRLDRGEIGGTGLALLLHAGLVIALTTSLASVPSEPEPPSMEVELVDSDEVALQAAATTQAPPPPSQAPAESAPIEPAPAPTIEPVPAPPQPIATPRPSPPRAQPTRPAASPPARPRPAAPRTSRLGDDFLKGIADASPSDRPAAQSAATFSAAAKASIDQAVKRQIQPCADRQPALGAGAERIRVVLNLRLARSGRLTRPPSVVRTSGVDDDNARFEQLVTDQAIAVYRACSPLRLPAELYSTPQGGWGNINMTYRVP
jgi:type IV secretory pathway VirB10-like protein